jgi:RNA polymerase-interacting CarD/CdnL/TRCF family regulator
MWRSNSLVDAPSTRQKARTRIIASCGVLVNMEKFQELWMEEKVKLCSILINYSDRRFYSEAVDILASFEFDLLWMRNP